jgi:hypothetical protein
VIRRMAEVHYSAWVTGLLIGLLISLVSVPTLPTWDDVFWRWHDAWRPVSNISVKQVTKLDGEVRVLLHVVRHRGECEFKKAVAFQEFPGLPAVPVSAARVDGREPVNIPEGMDLTAEWRLWPVMEGGVLRLLMEYSCDGRRVVVEAKGL